MVAALLPQRSLGTRRETMLTSCTARRPSRRSAGQRRTAPTQPHRDLLRGATPAHRRTCAGAPSASSLPATRFWTGGERPHVHNLVAAADGGNVPLPGADSYDAAVSATAARAGVQPQQVVPSSTQPGGRSQPSIRGGPDPSGLAGRFDVRLWSGGREGRSDVPLRRLALQN